MATVNKDFRVKHGLVVEGSTATVGGFNILTANSSTDSLTEGTTNLYFTDARADARVKSVLTGSTQTNISITEVDGDLVITAENGVADATTDDLDEGTLNLYFTSQRAIDAVSGQIDTDDVGEGTTNLYFTDQRAQDAVTNNLTTDDLDEGTINLYFTSQRAIDAVTGDLTSDDIDEGTANLYFTDERARLALSEGTGINYDNLTGEIAVDTDTIATKEYVDAFVEGLHVHASVAVATTENITLSPAPSTIDTVTLTEGMRVLVKNQSTASQNGIYVLNGSGNLVRAADFDTANEVQGGDFVFVTGGATYAATGWVQVNPVTNLGSDPIEWDQFSGAGEYTAGTGIDLDGTVFSLDFTEFDTDDINEGTTNLYFTDQRAQDAVTNNLTTDDLDEGTTNLYFTAQRAQDAVTNNLTTDDLDEGTVNFYYTDAKVRSVLTGATQTNISITEVSGQLVITAESGIEDATTDDLDEGTINLYFTEARAVTALEAITPDFPAVEINSVSKQIAGTINVEDLDTPEAVLAWPKATYRSAKIVVKLAWGSHTEVSEVLLTLDTSDNIAITEYAEVSTNGSLGDITADISGTDVRLVVDVNNNNTTVTAFGTLIA
jgi:HSP20 family molecular chaperone IbpA